MGETNVVTMSNVSPTRMIHMNGRVGPQPIAPSSFNSTLSGIASPATTLLSASVMARLPRRLSCLRTMCYRPYDRYLCGHRVYRPWVVHCRDGPCPNGDSWPRRQDWYLEVLCKECGRRRLHKPTRQAQ